MRRRDFLRVGGALVGAGGALGGTSALIGRRGFPGASTATAHPGPYEPYGSIDVEGAKEAVVGPDGEVAYLATTAGYAAVDVSVPDRPRLLADVREPLAERDGGPLRGIFDVKLDATDPDTLVVVGPANPLPGALAGVLVVDVSDPENPQRRAFHETSFPIHNCFVRDGVAYLTGNDGGRNPLVLLDTESGAELGRWALEDAAPSWDEVPSTLRSVHDVFVRDSTAFVAMWDAGTWILDVSDPESPTAVGTLGGGDPAAFAELSGSAARREATLPPGNHHYVATDESGTLLAVGRESWAIRAEEDAGGQTAGEKGNGSETEPDGDPSAGTTTAGGTLPPDAYEGGPSGIDLWDVSDPGSPEHRATIPAPPSSDPTYGGVWTTAHNFEIADGILYASWYQGGVTRHDVSDPEAPERVSWWRDPNEAKFWTARLARAGEREGFFVASSMGVGDVPARLYTFPDHAGEQADPPGVLPDREPTPVAGIETGSGGASRTAQTDATETRATETKTASATTESGASEGVGIGAPGFGLTAGVASLALAAWRLAGE
ncbi:LVIVD repeat-containing protein [Halobellus limi]|uniref:LVIVD repeat-containing protein n=1 Tax=Halobellus limi TaxID=699433 RepID=A0A1H5W414_9EURY|nr:hypothetical protein [Halobellus limi]SEF94232.1 LVIVD repeat-containing protein [Halobellus limi]